MKRFSLFIPCSQAVAVFFPPPRAVIDLDAGYLLSSLATGLYRYCQPHPSMIRPDPVSVLVLTCLVLNLIKDYKAVALENLIEISQPRDILWLMYGKDQFPLFSRGLYRYIIDTAIGNFSYPGGVSLPGLC